MGKMLFSNEYKNKMKAIVIATNLLRKKSPASSIEMSLLDEFAKRGIDLTAFCSSLGELSDKSDHYKTIIIRERKFWLYFQKLFFRVFPDLINIPDFHYYSIYFKLIKRAKKTLLNSKYDYIHSFSNPCSCHLAAYYLHKEFNLPWIATFFDSWTDYPELRYKTHLFKRINDNMERKVAEEATIIVHNNDNIADLWKKRYGAEVAKKIVVIPLNEKFERRNQQVTSDNNKDTLTISHVGTFYPFRTAASFIEGIRCFVKMYSQYRNRLKVVFVGNVLDSDVKKIKEYNLTDIFSIKGHISKEACVNIYQESDIFLATAEQSFECVTYPSKIIKYFYYQKPILGICAHDSVLRNELQKSRNKYFNPEDTEGIANYIKDAIVDYQSVCDFDNAYWVRFTVENVVDNYMDLLKHACINEK